MNQSIALLGLGIGWRPELALAIERRTDLGFVEVMAEDLNPDIPLPRPIQNLRDRGTAFILHGVSLSLGGADPLDRAWLNDLAKLAHQLGALMFSEHVAFVRAGKLEAGHLLPVARTRQSLDLLVANIEEAKAALPVPLVLENIAALFEWPGAEMDEPTFLNRLLQRTGCPLLLDVANVFANSRNHGFSPLEYLERISGEQLAYVHVAGGLESGGFFHDTHTHQTSSAVLDLLTELCARVEVPGVMLERDDDYATEEDLNAELDAIAKAVALGSLRLQHTGSTAPTRAAQGLPRVS